MELDLAFSTAQIGSLLHNNRGRASRIVKQSGPALIAVTNHANGENADRICQKHNCHQYATEIIYTADRKFRVRYVICALAKIESYACR